MNTSRLQWITHIAALATIVACHGDAEVNVAEEAELDDADLVGVTDLVDQEPTDASIDSPPLPPEVLDILADDEPSASHLLDHVFTLDHHVHLGPGRTVHVTESFTLKSWLRWPHRGALLLPGTVVRGDFYNLDVDGYRFQDDLAKRGFFAFALDYEGTPLSTDPPDGYAVTHDFLVGESRTVLAIMRILRLIPKMDVIGESNGGAIAAELCDDAARVRSCTMASMLWLEGTPFYDAVFLDPAFLAFLQNQPEGYLDVGPELYFNILTGTSAEVADEILATQPGRYALAPVLEPSVLPWYDPTRARVPGLIIQGTHDNIATQADNDVLALAYGSAPGAGGSATVVRIEGGGHIPRIQPPPINEQFKQAVTDFIDP